MAALRRAGSTNLGSGWAAIAIACALAVAAAGCSSSGHAALHPRIYAALGDSYAAGEGLRPFEADSGQCHRSPLAYPRLVAAEEASTLDFAPCTGATVAMALDVQLPSVDPATDLVTVTVGGNDVGFAEVVGACVVDPAPCSGQDAQVEASLTRLGGTLEAAYRQIKSRAPKARVLVVGYPQVVADPAKVDIDACPAVATPLPGRRITTDDARWLRDKGARLSAVIEKAARAAGATYVDVVSAFAGHEACTADPWLTGVTLTDLKASFHPTVAGQAQLARLVTKAVA